MKTEKLIAILALVALNLFAIYMGTSTKTIFDSVEDEKIPFQRHIDSVFIEVITDSQSIDSMATTYKEFIVTGPIECWIICYDSTTYSIKGIQKEVK